MGSRAHGLTDIFIYLLYSFPLVLASPSSAFAFARWTLNSSPLKVLTREDFAARREAAENAKKARGFSCGLSDPCRLQHPGKARLQSAPKARLFLIQNMADVLASSRRKSTRSKQVLASAQKKLTDFPVLRHLACREASVGSPQIWLVCANSCRRHIDFGRNWCAAVSSAPSSSSAIKIIVGRTRSHGCSRRYSIERQQNPLTFFAPTCPTLLLFPEELMTVAPLAPLCSCGRASSFSPRAPDQPTPSPPPPRLPHVPTCTLGNLPSTPQVGQMGQAGQVAEIG